MQIQKTPAANLTRQVREILFLKAKKLKKDMISTPQCEAFYRGLLRDTIDVYKESGKNPDAGLRMIVADYVRKWHNSQVSVVTANLFAPCRNICKFVEEGITGMKAKERFNFWAEVKKAGWKIESLSLEEMGKCAVPQPYITPLARYIINCCK